MKKLIVFPLALILLSGCSQKKQSTPVLSNISFFAQINYNDQSYVCDVVANDDSLELTVINPQEIKGLSVKIDKNGTEAELNGVSYAQDANSLPEGAVAKILFNILNDAADKTINVSGENCEINGEIDGINYDFYFSPSGLPLSLKVDNPKLTIEFSNVTLK